MCQKEPHELMAAEFLLGQPLGKLSDLREMRVEDHAFGFGRRACLPRQKNASISASMALGEGAIFSLLRLVIVRVLS